MQIFCIFREYAHHLHERHYWNTGWYFILGLPERILPFEITVIMLLIIWKRFNIFRNIENSPSFTYHLHSNVFLCSSARQRCKWKWRLHNKRRSVFCDSRSQNRSWLCNISFANNFKVIQLVRQTFFGGIDLSRRKGFQVITNLSTLI
jgi:hypothetical protein